MEEHGISISCMSRPVFALSATRQKAVIAWKHQEYLRMDS